MSFRGTFTKGIIVPDEAQSLPEGTRVAVNPLRASEKQAIRPRKTRVSRQRAPQNLKVHPLTALAGIWKDRADWKGKSSVQIVAELRRSGPRRG
jgi:hypothetical protein